MISEGEVKKNFCFNGPPGCWGNCGLIFYLDKQSGKITKIDGNASSMISFGYFCEDKVKYFPKWLEHPAQLRKPRKRIGERGEGRWQEISWDQALDEVADKLKELIDKYGPECIAVGEGTYRSDLYGLRARFLNLIGNPGNVFDPGTICLNPAMVLAVSMIGSEVLKSDVTAAKCIAVFGRNMPQALPLMWHFIKLRTMVGDKPIIIYADPRCTELARNADEWLQLRPGTDGAIFMAWINYIVKNDLYDKDFVLKWTNAPFLVRTDLMKLLRESDIKKNGSKENFIVWDSNSNDVVVWFSDRREFERKEVSPALEGTYFVELLDGAKVRCATVWSLLKERVSSWTEDKVSEISWVPADQISRTARLYATKKPSGLMTGVAVDQVGRNVGYANLGALILRIITGNIDVVGGDPIGGRALPVKGRKEGVPIRDSMIQLEEKLPSQQRAKQIGADKYKIMCWPYWEFVNPYYRKMYGIPRCMSCHLFLAPTPVLFRSVLTGKPYPVKAIINWTSNPMVWAPNTKLVYKALKSSNLELHVVCDHYMTPTAALADYVFPIASKTLEQPVMANGEDAWLHWAIGEQVLKPMDDRKSDFDFWKGLAVRFGLKDFFPWKTKEEFINWRLEPVGLTIKEAVQPPFNGVLRPDWRPKMYAERDPNTGRIRGFSTISGRCEIWSTALEELGYDPLPTYL
jgi:anaerobic selenocysteine-containing dehydrogenase